MKNCWQVITIKSDDRQYPNKKRLGTCAQSLFYLPDLEQSAEQTASAVSVVIVAKQ